MDFMFPPRAGLFFVSVVARGSHLSLRCSRTGGQTPAFRFIGGRARFESSGLALQREAHRERASCRGSPNGPTASSAS